MPIYGFVCTECSDQFEELVFSPSRINEVQCPSCDSDQVERQLSRVAAPVISGSSLGAAAAAPSCSPGGL
jgi:putative FmdB family regulatory protein